MDFHWTNRSTAATAAGRFAAKRPVAQTSDPLIAGAGAQQQGGPLC